MESVLSWKTELYIKYFVSVCIMTDTQRGHKQLSDTT